MEDLQLITKIMPKKPLRNYEDRILIKDGFAYYTNGYVMIKHKLKNKIDNCVLDRHLQEDKLNIFPDVSRIVNSNRDLITTIKEDDLIKICRSLTASAKDLYINWLDDRLILSCNHSKNSINAVLLSKALKAIPKDCPHLETNIYKDMFIISFADYEIYTAAINSKK